MAAFHDSKSDESIETIVCRSSKIRNSETFRKCHRKTPVLEFFVIKLQALRSPTQVFSFDICELLNNSFFYRTPPTAASENNEQQQLPEGFANSCYKIV